MAVSRMANVIVSATDGDTVSGPLSIQSVRVVAGGATGTGTLTVGGVKIWDSGNVSSNAATQEDFSHMQLGGGKTLTINLSGSGCKLYIYLK